MLTKLTLERFKNFKKAELNLGPLTVLIGANASGKSNLRDAFRFLHGISRGYTLADIMGEKYIEGGAIQWRGIRGGPREAVYSLSKEDIFALTIEINIDNATKMVYAIEVKTGERKGNPKIANESLRQNQQVLFSTYRQPGSTSPQTLPNIPVSIFNEKNKSFDRLKFFSGQPILSQIEMSVVSTQIKRATQTTMQALSSMRFLDLSPEAMRLPSLRGQTILGDRGENLSSVLFAICTDPHQKQALIEWVRELTPMDVADFKFPQDSTGRILVSLVEANGQRVSAYSASDGTLRFLAMIAALLGPEAARFYFFEELDNGLHPARLHLLLQLVERKAAEGHIQMVATTHSPQLLRYLSSDSLKYTSLVYRLPDSSDARIVPILNIADAQRVIADHDLANLYETSDVEFFLVTDHNI